MAEVFVVGKKISEMELVADISGNEKIPTGEAGDRAVTTGQLLTYVNDHSVARWGRFGGDISEQTDLQNQFTQERDTLKSYTDEQISQHHVALQERGAALPYEWGITYEENAVVVKDGVLQQWKDGVWRSAIESELSGKVDKSSNLSDLTSASEARTNLGLGTAATETVSTSRTDFTSGRLMINGSMGFAGLPISKSLVSSMTLEELRTTSLITLNSDGGVGYGSGLLWSSSAVTTTGGKCHGLFGGYTTSSLYHVTITNPTETNQVITRSVVRTTANTTVDSNGFIKNASPIVELYADKIELNDEAKLQNITFEKLGVGNYLIKNSTGLSNDGWYIEQPKDANGNVYHAVVYEQLENGDTSIKTFEQKLEGTRIVADLEKPVDIKENRFISIRLNELPKDTTAPQNPNIVDNEGNPAPSRLHELEEGVWVISDENAAILEQERLSAMPALTRRQFRLKLALSGYDLTEIESLINQIEDPMQRTIAQIEWQDATEFHRTNPTLLLMTDMLGLSTGQVDELWLQAQTL